LLEYWGGEDMEFAVPHCIPHEYMDEVPVQLQSGLGQMKLHQASLEPAMLCVGERIMSLRALSRKFFPVARTTNTNTTPGATDQQYFLPYAAPHAKFGGLAPGNYADFYTDLCSMFCYLRGGIRLKVTEASGAPMPADVFLQTVSWIDSTYVERYLAGGGMNSLNNTHLAHCLGYAMFGDSSSQSSLEVSSPQYGFRQARVNHTASASEAYNYRYYSSNPQLNENQVVVVCYKADTNSASPGLNDYGFRWYRACADDGDFSTFISIRPMFMYNAI